MQDAVEVAARERRRAVLDLLARADELEVGLLCERLAQRVEPVALAGEVDPRAGGLDLAVSVVLCVAHQ